MKKVLSEDIYQVLVKRILHKPSFCFLNTFIDLYTYLTSHELISKSYESFSLKKWLSQMKQGATGSRGVFGNIKDSLQRPVYVQSERSAWFSVVLVHRMLFAAMAYNSVNDYMARLPIVLYWCYIIFFAQLFCIQLTLHYTISHYVISPYRLQKFVEMV